MSNIVEVEPGGFGEDMAISKALVRVTAFAMAVVIALSGIVVPSTAYAVPELAAGSIPVQAAKPNVLSTQSQTDMTVFGADVSQWQGRVNWKKAAKKLKFAIVRCGYGSNLRSQDDTRWLDNVQGCRANGIPMGVYLYSYARNTTMAKSEAKHVIRCLREAGLNASALELPIYLDMEDVSTSKLAPATYAGIFKAFKKKLNAAGYANVGVYANSDWWSWRLSKINLDSELRWVAQWEAALFAGYPSLAEKGCGIWQYTDSVKVSGFRSRIDGDYARYDLSILNKAPARAEPVADGDPLVYAMRHAKTGDFIYTTNVDERDNLKLNGWKENGTLGWVPGKSSMPVFRFYNGKTKAHYYTTSKSKFNALARKKQWAYEGVAFYSQLPRQGTPVFRFTKSGKCRCISAQALSGWESNGICWYAAS